MIEGPVHIALPSYILIEDYDKDGNWCLISGYLISVRVDPKEDAS